MRVQARRQDDKELCQVHSLVEEQRLEIKKDMQYLKDTQRNFVRWTVFTWVITGLCSVAIVLMSFAYLSAKENLQVAMQHNHEKNAQQDAEIVEMRKILINISDKSDRMLDEIRLFRETKR